MTACHPSRKRVEKRHIVLHILVSQKTGIFDMPVLKHVDLDPLPNKRCGDHDAVVAVSRQFKENAFRFEQPDYAVDFMAH